jgi:hypothetical protein
MCGDVLPAEHRRRGSGGALLRFAATSTRTTPATATATLRRGQWAASLVVRRAITGRPGAAGVLAEDMEGAVGAVGRLLASPHARDQEAGRTLATDLLARQPLPPGGGAPSALLASARCSPSVLQAIATNSPAEVRTPNTPTSPPPLLLSPPIVRTSSSSSRWVGGGGGHGWCSPELPLLTHGSGHGVQALALLKRMERR